MNTFSANQSFSLFLHKRHATVEGAKRAHTTQSKYRRLHDAVLESFDSEKSLLNLAIHINVQIAPEKIRSDRLQEMKPVQEERIRRLNEHVMG